MKITEIEWKDGKCYKDSNGEKYKVRREELLDEFDREITMDLTLKELLETEFEEFVDWSKVEVDTPILVSKNGITWIKRHFAKYENEIVFGFGDGQTFWTGNSSNIVDYKYAKLGDAK